MMKLRLYLPVVFFVIALPALAANTNDAETRIKTAFDEAVVIAKASPNTSAMVAKLRPVLQKYINFDVMTRRAVGPGWRQFTPDQRTKAIDLFTTLVIRTYSEKLSPGQYPSLTVKSAKSTGPGRLEIPSTLSYQGSNYQVIYRVEEDDNWRISDIIAEGVSLVANYRSQFDALFKKGGAQAVLNSLAQTASSKK